MSDINSAIANILQKWSDDNISKAKDILNKYTANASMNLSQSLMTFDVKVVGKSISIGIGFANNPKQQAKDYYKYVDEGVKGIGFNDLRGGAKVLKGRNVYSPFKYKPKDKVSAFGNRRTAITTGKYSFKTKFVGKKMAKSIQSWIASKPIPIRTSKTASAKTHTIPKAEQLSWVIAKHIKRTGIGKTMFWSDTFNERAYQELADTIEETIATQFKEEIGKSFTININI